MSICSTGHSRHELHGAKPLAVTVAVARSLSGLGNTTIWALIKSGKLESVRVRRRRLIIYRSLEKLLSPTPSDSPPQVRRRGRPPKALSTAA
jgi:excisionase family DNA binding protein